MLGVSLLSLAQTASRLSAQTSARQFVLGRLNAGSPEAVASLNAIFEDGLRELDYLEGKNLIIERRYAGGQVQILPELAAQLVALKPDVIVAGGNRENDAAMLATKTIPIVMMSAADPVGSGYVASMARPDRNLTGLSTTVDGRNLGKRLQLLKDILPELKRVVVLQVTGESGDGQIAALDRDAKLLGVLLITVKVDGPQDVERALASVVEQRPQALYLQGGAPLIQYMQQICDFTLVHRLPASYVFGEFARADLLVTFGPRFFERYRRAAYYVDKVLRGASPAEVPVEQPSVFEMVLNRKTAKAIGVTIPRSVLLRADEVIE